MKYFNLNEFTRSNKASELKISNLPSSEHKANIELLTDNVLDKLREWYGKPINITSGYRSYDLNKAIPGSSKTSQHSKGEAADIVASIPRDNVKLFNYIKDNLQFDQLIWEKGTDSNPAWIHVSFSKSKSRKEILKTKDGKIYTKYA
jgi:hypothetical protein